MLTGTRFPTLTPRRSGALRPHSSNPGQLRAPGNIELRASVLRGRVGSVLGCKSGLPFLTDRAPSWGSHRRLGWGGCV